MSGACGQRVAASPGATQRRTHARTRDPHPRRGEAQARLALRREVDEVTRDVEEVRNVNGHVRAAAICNEEARVVERLRHGRREGGGAPQNKANQSHVPTRARETHARARTRCFVQSRPVTASIAGRLSDSSCAPMNTRSAGGVRVEAKHTN